MELRRVGAIEVRVRRSSRSRRPRAVYRPGDLPELVVPERASERTVERHLRIHAEWIARQVAKTPPPVLDLSRRRISTDEGRYEAYERIAPLAGRIACRVDVAFSRILVRDQRSRWGSCSTSGTLSFNWRLVLAPNDVLDYVVAHEVCHLRECNHSHRFWRLLESIRPGYPEQRAWLARHGWELLAFEPA
jgi:predicted metal-dependent hydrolase